MLGRTCCNKVCVNVANDPLNCGRCGNKCDGNTPYCDGSCQATPCTRPSGNCGQGTTCCGSQCCSGGQICCLVEAQQSGFAQCATPQGDPPTCPQGCAPLCVSDRDVKDGFAEVDDRAVLQSIATCRVDDPIDAHGAAFSSIRALYEMAEAQRARIDRLEKENAELRAACAAK
jgi:hypothetical protein